MCSEKRMMDMMDNTDGQEAPRFTSKSPPELCTGVQPTNVLMKKKDGSLLDYP